MPNVNDWLPARLSLPAQKSITDLLCIVFPGGSDDREGGFIHFCSGGSPPDPLNGAG